MQWRLKEKPRKGALSPVDMLIHLAASPVQLYVQTKEELLKPGYGQHSNILLPAPTALSPGDTIEWTWPWTFRHMDQQWLALLAALGEMPGSWLPVYSWNNN